MGIVRPRLEATKSNLFASASDVPAQESRRETNLFVGDLRCRRNALTTNQNESQQLWVAQQRPKCGKDASGRFCFGEVSGQGFDRLTFSGKSRQKHHEKRAGRGQKPNLFRMPPTKEPACQFQTICRQSTSLFEQFHHRHQKKCTDSTSTQPKTPGEETTTRSKMTGRSKRRRGTSNNPPMDASGIAKAARKERESPSQGSSPSSRSSTSTIATNEEDNTNTSSRIDQDDISTLASSDSQDGRSTVSAAANKNSRSASTSNQSSKTSSSPRTVLVPMEESDPYIRAVLELKKDDGSCRAIVKTKVKDQLWRICKLPDQNSGSGKRVKKWIQEQLHFDENQFEHHWQKNGKRGTGIQTMIYEELRIQRAYAVQLMKCGYYGESSCSSCVVGACRCSPFFDQPHHRLPEIH